MFSYFLTVKIMDDMHNLRIGDTLLEAAHEQSSWPKTISMWQNFDRLQEFHEPQEMSYDLDLRKFRIHSSIQITVKEQQSL